MPARRIHFQPHPKSGLQHRSHRSMSARDPNYHRKKLAKHIKKIKLAPFLERELERELHHDLKVWKRKHRKV